MKNIASLLLVLQIVFLFSQISINTINVSYTPAGYVPEYRDSRQSEGGPGFPVATRIPLINCSQVLTYLSQRIRYSDAITLYNIIKAESGCRAWVKNPISSAGGLAQILTSTWQLYGCRGNKYDPWHNLDCAIKIYKDVGGSAWEVCNRGVIRC